MLDPNSVINPDFRIMQTITNLAAFYGRDWCYPSQAKLLVLLKRFGGRAMSRRTLCRHLKALRTGMWLKRIGRHYRHPRLGFVMRSTVHVIAARWGAQVRKTIRAALRWSSLPAESIHMFRVPTTAQYRKINI